ncbi:paraslipin [Colwellia sp. PAMC 20917]|jgi:regulator of protease activity HflC (stomatin/prohibitin superfamily)|uniref:Paraslipin n=1 Tax=Colwellia hornerae TaxID=89402 RepID=A0A5C6QFU8_9GAMM|nr:MULTISPECIES: slipin family protein [Colwellia]MBA6362349.1 paraslipin [Colwellia sp. BRX8-8]AOW76941.1 paraslipin [Colwellia sp. PAMC 20917]MBA6346827.1 paraslipin [Colwellia sp. BRX8-9]MBA6350463.1 paraslipin [Colwellia sp. BRX9-1]MBA6355436.1 paraslipin [Colwellia sp. BRX8-3]|tara:strand:+ start:319 stop:1236 length:918 start_codon:yes stop_codon:yes gene_type:complete
MLATLTFVFLGLLFIVVKLVLIVPMKEVCIIERLGKFRAIMQPGLHFLIPFIDRVAYRHETREQVLDIPSQSCISRDNIQIEVDGLVYIQVMDGAKASYGIEDYRRACVNLAQTTMRSEIGKLKLGQTFSERDTLNETIVREIDKASDPWGIKMLRYEVRNITPSANVIHTLEKQMEAERKKRAEITLAEADKESTINLSEGERQEAINISEGDKQRQINEAHGFAKEIEILTQATAEGMNMIAKASMTPGGDKAIKMRLLEQFIKQTGSILKTADVSIMPAEMAKLEGFFEGMDKVTQTVQGAK